MTEDELPEIESGTRKRIREDILKAEETQLHLERPHNIIPEIVNIIEAEVDEVDEVSDNSGGDSQ